MRARVRVRGYGELNACGGKAKREEKRKKRENKREGSRSNSEARREKGEESREKREERREEKEEGEQKRGEILSRFTNTENIFNTNIRKLKNDTKSTIEVNAC